MLRMSCFPDGLPPSSTGSIALQPSHGRTNSCPIASDLEPLLALMLIEAPGIVQRLPGSPGDQGDQGVPIYSHHAIGARLPWSGYGFHRGLFPRKTREGQSRPSRFWWQGTPRTPPSPFYPAACVHPMQPSPQTSQSFSRPPLPQQCPAEY